jgi:hypothetical protein
MNKTKIKNFKAVEYSKIGFKYKNKLYYGVYAFFLYTMGFIKYYFKNAFKTVRGYINLKCNNNKSYIISYIILL